jgi:DNA invertase Pin-like site-specific DNA recombinase
LTNATVTTFADEMEREKARVRTRDAMVRKVRSGHVAGRRYRYDRMLIGFFRAFEEAARIF